jgi:hypothetical protein
VTILRTAFEAAIVGLVALGIMHWFDLMKGAESQSAPISTVTATCPPCPTTADNAKLREAHATCDQRAKEWEERARGVR